MENPYKREYYRLCPIVAGVQNLREWLCAEYQFNAQVGLVFRSSNGQIADDEPIFIQFAQINFHFGNMPNKQNANAYLLLTQEFQQGEC